MKYKRGCVIVWNETIDAILHAFEWGATMVMGETFTPLCTSGVDGNHSLDPESGHYQARSLDFGFRGYRSAGFEDVEVDIPENSRDRVVTMVQNRLDDLHGKGKYFVLKEDTHFHVQRNKGPF